MQTAGRRRRRKLSKRRGGSFFNRLLVPAAFVYWTTNQCKILVNTIKNQDAEQEKECVVKLHDVLIKK